ncbi:MAG: hypothetical protein HYY37_00985 [Candidatus Aenigmarchaeota archaeon]|nr:hypothetical protein [Candidatus Aenigmarchaeota archaeon]
MSIAFYGRETVVLQSNRKMPREEVRRRLEPYLGRRVSVHIEWPGFKSSTSAAGATLKRSGKHIGIDGPCGVGVRPSRMDDQIAGMFMYVKQPSGIEMEPVPNYTVVVYER